jgi:hypothetical protein
MAKEPHAHSGIEGADRVEPTASAETVYYEYKCDDCDSILLTIAEVKSRPVRELASVAADK